MDLCRCVCLGLSVCARGFCVSGCVYVYVASCLDMCCVFGWCVCCFVFMGLSCSLLCVCFCLCVLLLCCVLFGVCLCLCFDLCVCLYVWFSVLCFCVVVYVLFM